MRLSTGYDFLEGVIKCALGDFDGVSFDGRSECSGVWFYAPETRWVRDVIVNRHMYPNVVSAELQSDEVVALSRSADRSGYFIYAGRTRMDAIGQGGKGGYDD